MIGFYRTLTYTFMRKVITKFVFILLFMKWYLQSWHSLQYSVHNNIELILLLNNSWNDSTNSVVNFYGVEFLVGNIRRHLHFCHYSTLNWNIDGLVQERRNSSALAMGLCLSCINPSICSWNAPLWKAKIHWLCIVDIMTADDLVMWGARVTPVMFLN